MRIIATIAYGIIALIGGLIGYFQAGSKVSLISGGVSGAFLLLTAYLQMQGYGWALWLSAIAIIALIIVFGIRLQKTGKFMPAGLMMMMGVIALILMMF